MTFKSLIMASVLCFLIVPSAMANSEAQPGRAIKDPTYDRSGICVNTNNGREAIQWANNETQCRNSTNATMWIENGIVKHTYQHGN